MKLFKYTFLCQSALAGLALFMFSCKKQIENSKTISKTKIETPPLLDEKILINYIQNADIIKPKIENGMPFNQLDYDRIIAYDFAGDEETYPNAIDKKGKFVPVILKQQFLTQRQADQILSALAKNSSYGERSAACFQPHLGLVFFKGIKKVNQISVCLSCNSSITETHIPARTYRVFNKGTDNEYSFTGFTLSGKKAIINLCKEINFHYGKSSI
ncbi:hypothetical protein [Chryseobacterium flavum]|uniref:hypothetical protein n=1 Tax=Chryseobacterium flavum TaxID=415851 RepID=UPI0028ABA04C|nr:hypothetical protein [Chryseobacterium flavum]